MYCVTLRAHPFPDLEVLDQRILVATTTAGLRAWVEGRNTYNGTSIPLGFILQHIEELRPGYAGDSLREMSVTEHSFDVEVFDANRLVLTNQLRRFLLKEIVPLINDSLMDFGYLNTLFLIIPGALRSARQLALFSRKALLSVFQMLRIIDFITITGSMNYQLPCGA